MTDEKKGKSVEVVSEQDIEKSPATTNTNPYSLVQMAIKQGASVDALERVFALQERWQAAQAKTAFTKAMTELKPNLPVVKKLADGHNYKYAPLEDITNQVDPFISKHGFTYRWDTQLQESTMTVTCTATHLDGHQETSSFTAPILKQITSREGKQVTNEVQAAAGTITYLKRYTLCNLFGIMVAGEDQDARLNTLNAQKAPSPKDPRSKILFLLRELGIVSKDKAVLDEKVKGITGLSLVEKNYEEIVNRLEVALQEKNEYENPAIS